MTMKQNDKYEDYIYKITSPEELREAKWLIAQGDFKDMNDYIESSRLADIRIMKRADAEKKRKAKLRSLKSTETIKRQRAA